MQIHMLTLKNILHKILAGSLFILLPLNVFSQTVNFTSSNLPIVIINTNNQQIVDEPKITVRMGIIFNGEGNRNNITDPHNNFSGSVGIEIRGSTSQEFPKKQYGFETRDSLGNSLDVSLLGLPAENDWILFAPYNDKSLVRDALVYRLSNEIGRYASRSRYCELVINGEYKGVYVLLEKIKRNKNRVNISKMTSESTSGDDLTGGYIIKVDKDEGGFNSGWKSLYPPFSGSSKNVWYLHDYPDPEDITQSQITYIKTFMNNFENTMYRRISSDTVNICRYVDLNSAVDYFLLNELSKNVDAYRISSFMHKNKDSKGGLLTLGPIWDFNLSLGNCDYYTSYSTKGWMLDFQLNDYHFKNTDEYLPPFWWGVLYSDSSFRELAAVKWNLYRKNSLNTNRILALVDSLSGYIDEAQKRNFQKWPVLGTYIWPNYYVGKTYAEELNYLKTWITNRASWMDAELKKYMTGTEDAATGQSGSFTLEQNYPNPFNSTTVISYSIPENSEVAVRIYDILGREIGYMNEGNKNAGIYKLRIDLNSIKPDISSGIYFYMLSSKNMKGQNTTKIRQMVYLK